MFGLNTFKSQFENLDETAFAIGIQQDDAVVIDCRTPQERSEGYIPGSIHLDINNPMQFIPGIQELDPDKAVYIYCRIGSRSAAACAHLADIGFDRLYNLRGGIVHWNGPFIKDP